MGREGVGEGLLGAILSSVGSCESPNILIVSKIKTNANLLAILPNLAVKVIKKWE